MLNVHERRLFYLHYFEDPSFEETFCAATRLLLTLDSMLIDDKQIFSDVRVHATCNALDTPTSVQALGR